MERFSLQDPSIAVPSTARIPHFPHFNELINRRGVNFVNIFVHCSIGIPAKQDEDRSNQNLDIQRD